MTSRHGKRFPITDPLWGEFTSDQNEELWYFVVCYCNPGESVAIVCTKANSLLSQDWISSSRKTENMGCNDVNYFVTGGNGGRGPNGGFCGQLLSHIISVNICTFEKAERSCLRDHHRPTSQARRYCDVTTKTCGVIMVPVAIRPANNTTISCLKTVPKRFLNIHSRILLIHYIFLPCKTIHDLIERYFWRLSFASEDLFIC